MTTTALPERQSTLTDVARQMTRGGRGILAADESVKTMSARLEAEGIEASPATRQAYRELLLTADGLSDSISGVILSDETFGQQTSDGRAFPAAAHELGILPGIKVDKGTSPLPNADGALVTEGLDGLGPRLQEYAEQGAAFAKWRAVFDVRTTTPYAARANGHALARYAALCQQHGIVPIVEPEVLCNGEHPIDASAEATRLALSTVFDELAQADVDLAGIVLKPNFVTPGLKAPKVDARIVALTTFDVLLDTVPAEVAGIAFLSGGHSTEDACAFLTELQGIENRPWPVTFSFGRALVSEALATWGGSADAVAAAQQVLLDNCRQAAGAVR